MLLKNLAWLTAERLLTAATLLVSNVIVIRYLGPATFGLLAFYQATLAIFLATSEFGVRRILVVLKNGADLAFIYSQALRLKMFVAFAMAVLFATIMLVGGYAKYNWLIMLYIIFSPLEVYCYYFEGTLNNRPLALVRTSVVLAFALLRICLCFLAAPLPAIALTFVLPPIATMLAAKHLVKRQGIRLQAFNRTKRARTVLRAIASRGVYFWLSLVLIQLGTRVQVYFLIWLSGPAETGIYSAAQKLFEQGMSLFAIVSTVALPFISKRTKRNWTQDLQMLYASVLLLAILVAVPLFEFSDGIIYLLYGRSYSGAAQVFRILAAALPFMVLANTSGLFYSIHKLERLAFIRNLLALMLAVLLQVALVPKLHAIGAALAVLVTQCALCLVFEIFHPVCRRNVLIKWMAMKGVLSPHLYGDAFRRIRGDLKAF